MKNFIRMLEVNQFMTDYVVSAPEQESQSEFILNERPLEQPTGTCIAQPLLQFNTIYHLEDYVCIENKTSHWIRPQSEVPQRGVIIASIELKKATIMVPIEWQFSMEKLFAEFASINYLSWDLIQLTPIQAMKEFFRRLEAIATRERVMFEDELKPVFSTPQPGFFNENMLKLNELVIRAIACPPTVPIHMVNKLRLEVDSESILDLQWIWGMDKIRVFDHESTEMIKMDTKPLKRKLLKADSKAFGSFDEDWLLGFSDEALVLRILYQLRPVILQNMAAKSDAYIRQAINAFEQAIVCQPGTLEEFDQIRKAASSNHHGRGNRCFGHGRRPFTKPFFQGMNIQAWPMPVNNRNRWQRYGPVQGAEPLNPFETLKKDAFPLKDEPLSDEESSVDPKVTVSYKKLQSTGK